ncbi:MAG: T9SS type A sorting domain-containing protein [Bacteroidetes bacterium]|nr:T9SS type A sorting domain-containing protein [Bacteroidota bacterium]
MNVNLSDFQSGLYTVRIQTTKGVVVKKFVKL